MSPMHFPALSRLFLARMCVGASGHQLKGQCVLLSGRRKQQAVPWFASPSPPDADGSTSPPPRHSSRVSTTPRAAPDADPKPDADQSSTPGGVQPVAGSPRPANQRRRGRECQSDHEEDNHSDIEPRPQARQSVTTHDETASDGANAHVKTHDETASDGVKTHDETASDGASAHAGRDPPTTVAATQSQPALTPHLFDSHVFLLVGLEGVAAQEVTRLIDEHGGTVAGTLQDLRESDGREVVLAAPTAYHEIGYLYTVARGVPPLHTQWVKDCCSQGQLLPLRKYELPLGFISRMVKQQVGQAHWFSLSLLIDRFGECIDWIIE